ncbi:MAG: YicC family protein [Lachnospiraceae bacterium]|nr:YicC family protein [Lachnospiraceae bacterium]
MIKSMTGFGRGEAQEDGRKFTAEIKTVNHRFLEIGIKMPKALSLFEPAIRTLTKEYLERGKVDIFISYENLGGKTENVHYNSGIAGEYLRYLRLMSQEFGLEDDIRTSTLARLPDVLTTEEGEFDEEQLWLVLKKSLVQAFQQTAQSRATEGENLKKDILLKLDEMRKNVDFIEEHCPKVVEDYRTKLKEKVQDLLADVQVDEARLVTEVTIFADKVAVDEEIVRLRSHIDTMHRHLEDGGAIGRKLDFLAQEMNREANTTLSKAGDLSISDAAIELKTGIEKIREQIQNIE